MKDWTRGHPDHQPRRHPSQLRDTNQLNNSLHSRLSDTTALFLHDLEVAAIKKQFVGWISTCDVAIEKAGRKRKQNKTNYKEGVIENHHRSYLQNKLKERVERGADTAGFKGERREGVEGEKLQH